MTSQYEKVLAVVTADGPISSYEVHRATGIGARRVAALLSTLKNERRLVHISAWRRDEDGGRLYPRALYSIGTQRDAKRLAALTRAEYTRRYRRRTSVVASVFHLGGPIDSRRIAAVLHKGTP